MSVQPSSKHRLPAPAPAPFSLVGRIGWMAAITLALFAAFLASTIFSLTTKVKIMQTEAELGAVENQSLKQQLAAERILAARQIADLTNNAQSYPFTFIPLSPPETGVTAPTAMIVWQAALQTGVFFAQQLPPPGPDEEYRLWVDTSLSGPADVGTVTIESTRATKVEFKTKQPVAQASRFMLTRERKAATAQSPGTIVLTGTP